MDAWFASIIKPAPFYEAARMKKCYFYSIDLQGRVFLENVHPKNMASSIKDTAFLDFFFRRIRRVGPKQAALLQDAVGSYPFYSPCGVELNFIRPADSAIVFHDLDGDELVFAGTLRQPFHPASLAISAKTGRLYHELFNGMGGFGLIRSALAVTLSQQILAAERDEDQNKYPENNRSSGMLYIDQQTDGKFQIPWLPEEAEPGLWAMPSNDITNSSS